MKLNNYKKCDKCGELYNSSPFVCVLPNEERADARIKIYGSKYDLCPVCTGKIWRWLDEKSN